MALNTGQQMFHAEGYQTVGIAAITEKLGITPPSFYKAFGSKASYFESILQRYSNSVLALEDILRPKRPVAEALTDLLEQAARTYGEHPHQRGCLVLEAVRGNDSQEEVIIARRIAKLRRKQIHAFVSRENRQAATAVTDYTASVMSGLSASAREGTSVTRLLRIARAASAGIEELLRANR
ncbi:TetR/AcrR family transcriptional regulator [Granulicella cerasi]|uniref:TetR/AcrR family transcriptional regulator n=1 Tax=Granulicella cerasi TaxID=741063 RepID=A0ABW1ZA39_9BACT|nr:TetR/AcrR family transcriptional regulator [Granulicella cerasi]